MRKHFLLAFAAFSVGGYAQVITDTTKAAENWFNLDPYTNQVNGVGTERAYSELLKGKKSTQVIVGVIDSGVDFNHEDLKDVIIAYEPVWAIGTGNNAVPTDVTEAIKVIRRQI